MEEMRRAVKKKIAEIEVDKRSKEQVELREQRKDENDWSEVQFYKKLNQAMPRTKKTDLQQERAYKLLSRGIPSHFYRNLNKSQA